MDRSLIVGVCIAAIALVPVAGQAQQPPPPEYQPPPPPPVYQQPPPPQYYVPAPPQYYPTPPPRYYIAPQLRPPPNGIGAIVTGSIFLGLGIVFVGSSVPFFQSACVAGHTCLNDLSSPDYSVAAGGVTLATFGSIFFVVGAVLLPIGIVQASRYSRWRSEQPQPRVQLAPSGLRLTF